MTNTGQFDADLGALVRDPANAGKTASELLEMQEKTIRDRLADCDCSNRLKYVIVFAVSVLIGGLVWLLPW